MLLHPCFQAMFQYLISKPAIRITLIALNYDAKEIPIVIIIVSTFIQEAISAAIFCQ